MCNWSRCIGVLLLCGIANHYRLQKLGAVDQFVMMYGGLRGAVAFALVLLIDVNVVPHAHMFVTTTIAVVYWTVFVQVGSVPPKVVLVGWLLELDRDDQNIVDEVLVGLLLAKFWINMNTIILQNVTFYILKEKVPFTQFIKVCYTAYE